MDNEFLGDTRTQNDELQGTSMQDAQNADATISEQKSLVSSQNKEPHLGSPLRAIATNTVITYAGLSVTGIFSAILPLTKLNQTLIGVLGTSNIITNCIISIAVARKISKNGGKKPVLFSIASTFTGMVSLTALSTVTDIRTIDGLDWRYATMLMSGYLIGLGSGIYSLFLDSIKRATHNDQIPIIISAHGAIVNSASITTPLIVNELSRRFNYTFPFALYTGLLALDFFIAAKFLEKAPIKTPAQENAETSTLDFVKENLQLIIDRRGFFIYLTVLIMLGSYLVTGTILPTLLKSGYDIDPTTAVYIAALANLDTILSRLAAGKIIAKWDEESGGMHVFLAGCAIITAACIPLTFSNLPQWTVYLCIALMNMGFGLSMFPPATIAMKWKEPKNENLKPYNPDIILGAMGMPGTFGGFILPLALGFLVESEGKAGYQHYFYLIMAMMLMSAITIPIVDYTVRHTKEECQKCQRFFDKPMTLFGFSRFANKNKNKTADIEIAEEKNLLPSPHRLAITS